MHVASIALEHVCLMRLAHAHAHTYTHTPARITHTFRTPPAAAAGQVQTGCWPDPFSAGSNQAQAVAYALRPPDTAYDAVRTSRRAKATNAQHSLKANKHASFASKRAMCPKLLQRAWYAQPPHTSCQLWAPEPGWGDPS